MWAGAQDNRVPHAREEETRRGPSWKVPVAVDGLGEDLKVVELFCSILIQDVETVCASSKLEASCSNL